MIVLTDCLTDKPDEGIVKTASVLVSRLQAQCPDITVIPWGGAGKKVLIPDRKLRKLLGEKKDPVLYIPFSSNSRAGVLRTLLLSGLSGNRVWVLFALCRPMDALTRWMLRHSGAMVLCLSADAREAFRGTVGARAVLLKAGVDTRYFVPADCRLKARLREKYGVHPGKKVLLHVGHMKEGRNIRKLLNVGEDYHVFLAVSPRTAGERDEALRQELESRPHTTMIDTYVPGIRELYQMADVYFFPVSQPGNCIDMPLSVLEAAACNVPVVAGMCPQLREFAGVPGFWFTDSFAPGVLNPLLDRAVADMAQVRSAVLAYDWDEAVKTLREVWGI